MPGRHTLNKYWTHQGLIVTDCLLLTVSKIDPCRYRQELTPYILYNAKSKLLSAIMSIKILLLPKRLHSNSYHFKVKCIKASQDISLKLLSTYHINSGINSQNVSSVSANKLQTLCDCLQLFCKIRQ